jgi:hypothetical protein
MSLAMSPARVCGGGGGGEKGISWGNLTAEKSRVAGKNQEGLERVWGVVP